MTRQSTAKIQPRTPRRLWDEVDARTLVSDDLVVWNDLHSIWPWRAKNGETVLQHNGRDRRFASSDAAMTAAERQWGMSR